MLSWVSFRENNAPPVGAIFGIAPQPGMTVAAPTPRGRVPTAGSGSTAIGIRAGRFRTRRSDRWSTEGAPSTPFVRTEGLVSGRCVNDGQRGYLSVRVHAIRRTSEPTAIYGEVGLLGMFVPGWGMHLADVAEAQGDLIRQVGDISDRSRTGSRPAR